MDEWKAIFVTGLVALFSFYVTVLVLNPYVERSGQFAASLFFILWIVQLFCWALVIHRVTRPIKGVRER